MDARLSRRLSIISEKKQRDLRATIKRKNVVKMLHISLFTLQLFCVLFIQKTQSAQLFRRQSNRQPATSLQQAQQDSVVAEMQVLCHSDAIVLLVNTNNPFNGMLYAKDAANMSGCVSEFHSATNMTYRLPLKSCATLSADMDDGIEYFNTIVVQPHMRLMTNQGKGYHVRCKYQTRERTIANTQFNVSAAFHMQNGPHAASAPLLATASMPMCTMKIYRIDQENVAESVKVGDKLVMVIEIDRQDMYGMRVSNCLVRDGMNKAEQLLISEFGCPLDESIMPRFEYEHNNTRAVVAFRAHKFPHTSSVYYQCNVRLCINNGGCDQEQCQASGGSASGSSSPAASAPAPALASPPAAAAAASSTGGLLTDSSAPSAITIKPTTNVSSTSAGGPRRKRFVPGHGDQQQSSLVQGADSDLRASPTTDMSFDVYSGLFVSDADASDDGNTDEQQVSPTLVHRNRAHTSNYNVALRDENLSFAPSSTNTQLTNAPHSGVAATSYLDVTHDDTSAQSPVISCLTVGKASLLVVLASLGSVALVLLVACQAGLLSLSADSDERTSRDSTSARHLSASALHANNTSRLQKQRHLSSANFAASYHNPVACGFNNGKSSSSSSSLRSCNMMNFR